jgi:hypothetical protein
MPKHLGGMACALAAVTVIAASCANGGSSSDEGVFDEAGADAPKSGSSGGSGSSSGAASSSGGSSGSASSSGGGGSSSGSGGDAAAGGDGSSGDDGGGTDGSGGDDASGTCGAYPDQCTASATSLGSVAGDESGSTVGASGYTAEWLRLDETEQDSSIIGHAMIFTATLTSPPGMNYDLYAYLGSSIGDIQCSSPKGQSTNPAGQQDQVSFQWGETTGGISNGSDDSATVMIEVRWVSGACSTSQNWSISAHGD